MMRYFLCFYLLLLAVSNGLPLAAMGEDSAVATLRTNAQVDSAGVFLSQVIIADDSTPQFRLADAPAFGQVLTLTRIWLSERLQKQAPDWLSTNWAGADRIRISRRSRLLQEGELRDLVTAALQRDVVRDRGELELRFTRNWTPVAVPDDPLETKILDLPASGINPGMLFRFELRHGIELIGTWQMTAQARVYSNVYMARNALKRGQSLHAEDLLVERRDILTLRDVLTQIPFQDGPIELAEPLQPGVPISSRSIRFKPIVQHGQVVDGKIEDGALSIALKVEVLEDGLSGQTVRVRNVQTKRELRGKVQNEQTILLVL